jgi:predicted site-specific integrase-resolvase
MAAATYRAEQLAEHAGVSTWAIYQTVRDGSCPFPFVRVGRRIVFPKTRCDEILGISGQPSEPGQVEASS